MALELLYEDMEMLDIAQGIIKEVLASSPDSCELMELKTPCGYYTCYGTCWTSCGGDCGSACAGTCEGLSK